MLWEAHDNSGQQGRLPDTPTRDEASQPCEYMEVVAVYRSVQARWLPHTVNGEEMSDWPHADMDIGTYIGEATGQGWHLISVKVPAHLVPDGNAERRIYVFKRSKG